MILTSFLVISGCKTNAQKLKISSIYSEPKQVTKEIPETGKTHTYTTRKEVTERLDPLIFMLSKNAGTLTFCIQGNISSSGHSIHKVRKIRFERGAQSGNTVTLKYYVEIKKVLGKENADVLGYNYTKDETYKIPNDIKIIRIELYEERINDTSATKPKLLAQQSFNFFPKI
ncbi:hypothetical protein [Chryseobacterium rhizosphaerae]|uniref:Lipoprotein n=1 Tax=Chryseobacterium rhizosphaerae TaxID=395937 RepID=A0ABX9IN82_9FLAO|nr:hypothetical protein [Chryseobacterium rhizosphaerae]REC76316.1 hypothetical protein DRF57_08710 [Chryseobacterium rhizosphaerae]GEN65949.1 hypothetical protein CRH01_05170 [Chryseobacterium rhizosphaerae]